MDLNLENRVAIVTGASAGLGRAMALSLAEEGVRLAVSGRNQKALDAAAGEIASATGSDVLAVPCDMSEEGPAAAFVDRVLAEFGTVHILVNNVGQARRGLFTTLGTEAWRSSLDTNLMSAVHTTGNVVPVMQEQRWGRIINIAALSATEPNCELVASNVAKSALLGFSKTLSRELAGDNITVNSVSPGLIESPQNEGYFSDAERKRAIGNIPMGRFGDPEEFAHVVTFLCSRQAGYITGQNLIVDGGMSRGF